MNKYIVTLSLFVSFFSYSMENRKLTALASASCLLAGNTIAGAISDRGLKAYTADSKCERARNKYVFTQALTGALRYGSIFGGLALGWYAAKGKTPDTIWEPCASVAALMAGGAITYYVQSKTKIMLDENSNLKDAASKKYGNLYLANLPLLGLGFYGLYRNK